MEGRSGVMVSVEKQLQLKFVPFDELIDPETMMTRGRVPSRETRKKARDDAIAAAIILQGYLDEGYEAES